MPSLTDIAKSVLERTRDQKLAWTELSPDSYVATIGEDSIIIERRAWQFVMRFVDPRGTELDRTQGISTSDATNEILSEIFELARRKALRVDETLLNIKRLLDSL